MELVAQYRPCVCAFLCSGLLADAIRMRFGTRWSRRFIKYNERGHQPWLGFSIFYLDRCVLALRLRSLSRLLMFVLSARSSLDIICKDDQQALTWFLGLQSLTPMSSAYLTKGQNHKSQ